MAQSRPRIRALDALITDVPHLGPSTGTDKEAYIGIPCSDPSNLRLSLFLVLRLGRIARALPAVLLLQTQLTLLMTALLAQKHQQQKHRLDAITAIMLPDRSFERLYRYACIVLIQL